jgi:hypothetical protein
MAAPQESTRIEELEETIANLNKRLGTWKTLYKELNEDFNLLAMSIIEGQKRNGQFQ